jgi:hypothetical protein
MERNTLRPAVNDLSAAALLLVNTLVVAAAAWLLVVRPRWRTHDALT